MTCDRWQVKHDTWQVQHDMWPATCNIFCCWIFFVLWILFITMAKPGLNLCGQTPMVYQWIFLFVAYIRLFTASYDIPLPGKLFHIRSGPPHLWTYWNCCQVCSIWVEHSISICVSNHWSYPIPTSPPPPFGIFFLTNMVFMTFLRCDLGVVVIAMI